MSVAFPSPLARLLGWLILGCFLVPPIGLFVLRRHLANAHGVRRAVKMVLVALTALTAPVTGGLVLIMFVGGWEALSTLWSALKGSW